MAASHVQRRATKVPEIRRGDTVVVLTGKDAGKRGVIERVCGLFPNPEELAYGFTGEPQRVLYRVRFRQADVWGDYAGPERDGLELEVYEHWLEPV